jgi:putative transposase
VAGARQRRACEILGIDERSLQRWKRQDIGEDRRAGPSRPPINKLTDAERRRIVEIAGSPRFRDLSPRQIVPKLADEGVFIASESSFYRVLRVEGQLAHRGRAKAPTHRRPDELVATAPNQVWCWDITYLPSLVRGKFFYCYTVLDIFSRKIVGKAVHDCESDQHAAVLIATACAAEGVQRDQLVVHSDNGHPMRGATMLATLQSLGVAASFSRPAVSDDNPFIEALHRTMKYRPEYPSRPFATLQAATAWVDRFVDWYNSCHLHSAISFVTPQQRHSGTDTATLEARRAVYDAARRRHPSRWSGACRSWARLEVVRLNPRRDEAGDVAA